jgi:hypothetical protein
LNNLFADASPFWSAPNGTGALWLKTIVALVLGFAFVVALIYAPARARKPVVFTATFLSGLYYVLRYLWPAPIDRKPADLPRNVLERAGFWLNDAQPVVTTITNVVAAFLIGLGIYSLVRVHGRKVMKMQQDWGYSAVLLICMVVMLIFGLVDWKFRLTGGTKFDDPSNWLWFMKVKDLLFDGLLQQMDAAMFSLIAFYILSAAYRAFRVRSIEATILLATALIVMLSLMGAVSALVDSHFPDQGLASNFKLSEIAGWLSNNVQTPSIRGIDFGVGIGAMAMGLRMWLGLEKTGGS